jgi:hypothetical protein
MNKKSKVRLGLKRNERSLDRLMNQILEYRLFPP